MTTEIEPVRSQSPELAAMTLPKLKTVATQLGVDGAAKMKKEALVEAIADLQAKNREAAKAEREARREARNNRKRNQGLPITIRIQMMMAMMIQRRRAIMIVEMIAMTVGDALIAMTVVEDATVIAIATVTVLHVKSVNQLLAKTMF